MNLAADPGGSPAVLDRPRVCLVWGASPLLLWQLAGKQINWVAELATSLLTQPIAGGTGYCVISSAGSREYFSAQKQSGVVAVVWKGLQLSKFL